ncbi:MAG: hypothetical protein D6705_17545 [Deltaproteobacteria bacterium]|nr:MAG: hypothetical protein D6705_17545 [Deltaproteobacteria bacterium]
MRDRRLEDLVARLAAAGLDVVAPFAASAYDRIRPDGFAPLRRHGREDALAVLVGNTRALWPKLVDAVRRDPSLATCSDPVDTYVVRTVTQALDTAFGTVRRHVVFAHDTGTERVAMVHAAEAAGIAQRGPTALAIHGTYGPWWALRALVTFDLPPVPSPAPPRICDGCPAPCRPAADHVARLRARAAGDLDGRAFVRRHFDALVAMRAACPVGARHRYGDAQLRYHYLLDRAGLRGSARSED